MLRALIEQTSSPTYRGTSVGAFNGAAIAAQPTLESVKQLEDIWTTLNENEVFSAPFSREQRT